MGIGIQHKIVEVVVAQSATVSAFFIVEPYSIFYMARFPDMDAGTVGLELSLDNGANYDPIFDPADSDDAVLCKSGSDPGWIDFSDWVRGVPADSYFKLRFTCASQTTKEITITVLMRG